jgi:hypothetical protein
MNTPYGYDPAAPTAMRRLAQSLLAVSATINAMAADMAVWNDTHDVPDDAEPIPEVLVKLMAGSFDYLIQRHGTKNVKRSAQIVEHALDLICSEIFVVSDEFLDELENDETEPGA